MARTRSRSKGRRGGEGEKFAYLPVAVLTSTAVTTMPHAALRVLAALVAGYSKERNGLQMCSNSYAATFGITSATTLHASLDLLRDRGLIVKTWETARLSRKATHYAVTWWPILYRDGQPLTYPEPATHAYAEWQPISPPNGPKERTRNDRGRFSPVQPMDQDSPSNGPKEGPNQSSGWTNSGAHQSTGWRHSRSRSGGKGLAQQLADARLADVIALARAHPELSAADLAGRCRVDEATAHRALQTLQHDGAAA